MEPENNSPKKNTGFNAYWIYGIIFLAIIGVNLFYISNPTQDPINYSRFQQMAANGDLGPVYGKQWRSWETKDGTTVDQIKNVIDELRSNPDSRRLVVSAWNVGELDKISE